MTAAEPSVCALLTDFGDADNFVGVMKGVILRGAPSVKIVDLSHGVAPQDVEEGAFQLLTAYSYFPAGTVFVCVVDPGVGTGRSLLFVQTARHRFIGPDNGVLSWVLDRDPPKNVIRLDPKKVTNERVSRTFHGRDLMAPAAALILSGVAPSSLGPAINAWTKISFPPLKKSGAKWTAKILSADRFGNLITNIPNKDVETYKNSSKIWIETGTGRPAIRGISETYASGGDGRLMALAGSGGFIELAVRNGNARKKTGLKKGDTLSVLFRV